MGWLGVIGFVIQVNMARCLCKYIHNYLPLFTENYPSIASHTGEKVNVFTFWKCYISRYLIAQVNQIVINSATHINTN